MKKEHDAMIDLRDVHEGGLLLNGDSIKAFLKNFGRMPTPVHGPYVCACGSEEFYDGPSAGLSRNIQCAACGKWYNDTPFGLKALEEG